MFGLKTKALAILAALILSGCGEVATVTQDNQLGAVQNVKLAQATLAPILVDLPYKEVVPVEGGQPPLQFTILGGTLPAGLTLGDTSGIISGLVGRSEIKTTSNITVQVSDALGLTSQQSYTMQVNEYAFTIVPEKLENIVPGIPFLLNMGALGASPPVKFSTSGTLPPGLTLDETGLLKTGADGIAIQFQNSEWRFDAIATDANGVVVTRKYELKLGEYLGRAPLAIQTDALPTPTAIADYAAGVVVTGGVVPYTFSVSTGGLPPGLTLDAATGAISGVVSAAGAGKAYTFAIKVVDAKKTEVIKSFSMVVEPYSFTVEPATLPTVTPGVPFSMAFSAPGAQPVIQYSASGSLPPGLTLNGSGTLSTGSEGIAEAYQNTSWSFSVSATDANGIVKSRSYTLALGSYLGNSVLTIVNDNIATPSAGNAYSAGIAVSGGKSPYAFSISAGTLPSGLNLSPTTGLLTGTVGFAAANTAYDFTVRVVDASSVERTKRYQGVVSPGSALLTIHTASIVNPTAGSGYSAVIAVTGGAAPYVYSLNSGVLPTGLTLGAGSGIISGTVSFAIGGQNFFFEILVTDSVGQTVVRSYNGTIASGIASLAIETDSLPTIYAGNSYTSIVTASGGKTPYTFVIDSGGLVPSGLSLASATGIISGSVPHNAANAPYVFTVRVTDDIGQTQTRTFSGNVSPYTTSLVPTSFVAGDPQQSYSASLTTVGGQSAYTYAIIAGALPAGLSLNTSTGAISGTIAEAEAGQTRNVTISSVDANGISTSRAYSIVIAGYVVALTTASLPTAYEASAYTATLAATGGTGPYTYEYTGTLPTGIGMSNLGVFFGSPAVNQGTTTGTVYPIAVRAKDAAGRVSVSTALSIMVSLTVPVIANVTPPTAILGNPYSHSLSSSGGRGPYTYSLDSGTLPTGLSLNSSGVISGTASAATTCPAQTFVARIVDSSNPSQQDATRSFCIASVNGLIFLNPSLPTIVRGQLYTQNISVSGGTGPYTFSAVSLPSGMSIAANGELSGSTIVAPGNYSAYISASDSTGLTSTIPFILTVANALSIDAVSFPIGGSGKVYSNINITASGGISPYEFSISSGSMPSGLVLSSAGVVSGTVSLGSVANSPYSFRIRVADSSGLSSESSLFTIPVTTSPVILTKRLETTVTGADYRRQLEFSGGIPPFSFSATGLPAGLSINTLSGMVTGSTLESGNFTVEVTLVDSGGISTTANVALTVNASAKTLNFFSQKFSEPCPQSVSFNCDPRGQQVGKLVTSQTTTNYLVYSANISPGDLASPVPRIYIARLNAQGRIPTPGTSVFSTSLTPDGYVTAIEIADIDLDGHLDIIAAVYGRSGAAESKLSVYWNTGTVDGNGMPEFTAPTDFGSTSFTNRVSSIKAVTMRNGAYANTTDILAVDWRHDSPDNNARIVAFMGNCTADCSGSRATALPANPATAFNTTLANSRVLRYVTDIDAGRFTDTECKSIVVAGSQDNSLTLSYLHVRIQDKVGGVCQGTFGSTMELYLGAGTLRAGAVAVANFNNDNYDDIAVVMQNVATTRVVLMDSSGGGFTGATQYSPSLVNIGSEIAPYCLDGSLSCSYPGLVVTGGRKLNYLSVQGQGGNGFLSFLPNTLGTFEDGTGAQRIDLAAPIGIGQQIIVSPIVSTNKNDIILMGYDNYAVPFLVTYENNGGSTSLPMKQMAHLKSLPDDFGTAAEVGTSAVVDLNGDGIPDLVSYLINQQAVVVHQGPLDVTYGISPEFFSAGVQHGLLTPWHQQHAMAAKDINGNGHIDIVVTGAISRSIAVMFGDGTGQLASPVLYSPASGDKRPYAVALGDVNGDGIMDIVTVSDNPAATEPTLSVLHGIGDGSFNDATVIATGTGAAIGNVGCTNPRNIILNDLDRDGRPEIILSCYNNAQIVVFRRHTDGSWKKNNGTLAISGTNGTAIAVGDITPSDSCYSIGADFINRPCVDLLITQYVANATVRVLTNFTMGTPTGSGTFNVNFTTNSTINMYGYAHDISIADFDQDGISDFVVSMGSQRSATTHIGQTYNICRGNGTGGCLAIEGGGMDLPLYQGVLAADFDNDGLVDLISTSRTGQRLPFLMISRHRNISQ